MRIGARDSDAIRYGALTVRLRRILRGEVLALCCMIFTADIVSGIVSPTFSLYARSLGASLTLIGMLSSIVGLTRIFASVPVGMLSDARGPKNVLSGGMLLFVVSSLLYTVAPSPYLLLPIRVVAGLAMVSTFFVGVAYLSGIVAEDERGIAIGLYATAMGLGFTVGPLVGGRVAMMHGYRASYRVAALCALVGFVIARVGLTPADKTARPPQPRGWMFTKLGPMVQDPNLLAASLANLFMSTVFVGAIANFFPLYAASLSVDESAIGTMFAIRAFASASTRLPTGLLTTKLSSRNLMFVALALAMVASLSISFATIPLVLALFLATEGISFGMFLTSGQAFVAEHVRKSERGTAIGLYSTAGSFGSSVGPFLLGLVAELWGLATVFRVTAALVLAGIVVVVYVSARQRR
jgi:DHA1 family multidrug resistance protein-like MFS transporter